MTRFLWLGNRTPRRKSKLATLLRRGFKLAKPSDVPDPDGPGITDLREFERKWKVRLLVYRDKIDKAVWNG